MAAHVREERRRIRQLHNARRPRLFRDRTNPLEELPAEAVFERFWFSPATIMFIMTIVGEAASQTMRNCPLPPLMKLLVCLRYLASGTFHINVGDSLGISRQATLLPSREPARSGRPPRLSPTFPVFLLRLRLLPVRLPLTPT